MNMSDNKKSRQNFAENLEQNGIKQIKEKGIPACELTVEKDIKVFDNGYMAQIELFDQGPEVLYFRAVLQLPGAVDGLVLTKDKIIGVKYTISPNLENPFQAFVRNLKQIPFFKANNQKYSIYFCWMLTSNCTGMIFNQAEKTIEGITFNVRAERFGEEVEEMRQQMDEKNEREIAMLVANMTLTLNPGPKRKNSNNDGVVVKRARQ